MKPETIDELRELAAVLEQLQKAVQELGATEAGESSEATKQLEADIHNLAASQQDLMRRIEDSPEGSPDVVARLMEVLNRGGAQLKADYERVASLLKGK
jgi:hypothetical protein